jgi:hypothetical protein
LQRLTTISAQKSADFPRFDHLKKKLGLDMKGESDECRLSR